MVNVTPVLTAVLLLSALCTVSRAAPAHNSAAMFRKAHRRDVAVSRNDIYHRNHSVYFNITNLTPNNQHTPVNDARCPDVAGSWWPGSDFNLKSTCPWIWQPTDLGEGYYPRYINEAVCLCSKCRLLESSDCAHVRMNITIFRISDVRNNDGQMWMTAEEKEVNVACTCTGNSKTGPSQPEHQPVTD